MTITSQNVKDAFYTSGSEVTLTYFRSLTTSLPDVPIFISSSAKDFYLRVYPTSSVGIVFRLSGSNTLVNENSPITLPPASGSNDTTVTILASINAQNFSNIPTTQTFNTPTTQNFSAIPVESKKFDIQFNLVAMIDRELPDSNTDESDDTDSSSTKKQLGEMCNINSECYTGYCYNPNNQVDGGICANPPALLDDGFTCTANTDCKSNYCNNPNLQPNGGICLPSQSRTDAADNL
jgi:hypothetical protein